MSYEDRCRRRAIDDPDQARRDALVGVACIAGAAGYFLGFLIGWIA